MTRTLIAALAATLLLAACGPADLNGAVAANAVSSDPAIEVCTDYFDWSTAMTDAELVSPDDIKLAYVTLKGINDDAAGTSVSDELSDVVEVIDDSQFGPISQRRINDVTLELAQACRAAGWGG